MNRLALALLVALAACAQPDSEPPTDGAMPGMDHAAHASQAPPEPVAPALGDLSLYQLESAWTDQHGQSRLLTSLGGRPQLVAMTYTSCQVSCPVIVADLKRIEAALDEHAVEAGIVLFSLDPARDTPEQLAAYAAEQGLSDRWTLLRAPDDQVREMAALLGVRYRRSEDGEYAHSNMISVLDAGGALSFQQKGLGPDLVTSTIDFMTGR
jgi:protein SCO1/2